MTFDGIKMKNPITLILLACCLMTQTLLGYKYDLSICMIFKNEAAYLKEWIEYHRLVGVQHFYLYNDHSIDHYQRVLAPYIRKGIVELLNPPKISGWNERQTMAYNKILKRSQQISKWVAFIDSDEFLVPSWPLTIPQILSSFENAGGVALNYRFFGTSNVAKIPKDKLLIECLTKCAQRDFGGHYIIKSVVRPERCVEFTHPHFPIYHPDWSARNTDGTLIKEGTPVIRYDKLWINHYWTRDEDFLYHQKIPRRVGWGINTAEEVLDLEYRINTDTDDSIFPWIPQLRKKIFPKRFIPAVFLRQSS